MGKHVKRSSLNQAAFNCKAGVAITCSPALSMPRDAQVWEAAPQHFETRQDAIPRLSMSMLGPHTMPRAYYNIGVGWGCEHPCRTRLRSTSGRTLRRKALIHALAHRRRSRCRVHGFRLAARTCNWARASPGLPGHSFGLTAAAMSDPFGGDDDWLPSSLLGAADEPGLSPDTSRAPAARGRNAQALNGLPRMFRRLSYRLLKRSRRAGHGQAA